MKHIASKSMLALLVLLCFTHFTHAQQAANSFFRHLMEAQVEELTITTDITTLLGEASRTQEEISAELSYLTATGQAFVWQIGLKPRGKFRLRTCDFPPLRIDLSKKELAAAGLSGEFDKYKLITHCDDDRLQAKESLLREYTAYQLYEALTPNSYDTYLLRVTYVDSAGKFPRMKRFAILQESTDELAARIQSKECETCINPEPGQLDAAAENLHAVFQYMIGNTDFSLPLNRNIKLFQHPQTGKLIPVGYDFDFSALVNAPYALPASHLGQQRLTDRIFLGMQTSDTLMTQTLRHFLAHKTQLLDIIGNQKQLSVESRYEMKQYIETFFATFDTLHTEFTSFSYGQLRKSSPTAVPDGGNPLHYGVGK
ncbi:MAG: hypothetical protein R2795_27065 [Saprospiraceae bacterium]